MLLLIHLVNLCLIVLIDNRAADLQRVGQLARLHREVMRQERDTLDLLVIGQLLLQGIDTLLQHLLHLLVGTKILTAAKGDMVLTSPFLYKTELWNNECRHKLALVCNDCHLVDKLVNKQQCLYLLWSDILTMALVVSR